MCIYSMLINYVAEFFCFQFYLETKDAYRCV